MMRKIFPIISTLDKHAYYSPSMGIHVKTGLHAGDWRCTACQGQAIGSNLIKPKCDYCELI
jgi:hypothetical protein